MGHGIGQSNHTKINKRPAPSYGCRMGLHDSLLCSVHYHIRTLEFQLYMQLMTPTIGSTSHQIPHVCHIYPLFNTLIF